MSANEGMIQLTEKGKDSFNPLGYGVIGGFNWTEKFKKDPWGKLLISKDILK